jgi:hypothetical protein
MSIRFFSCLAAFLVCAPLAMAVRPRADATPAPAKGAEASKTGEAPKTDASGKVEVPPYVLKNHSTFNTAAVRAPFWPIGWVKPVAGAPVQAQEVAVAPKVLLDQSSFVVTSIMIGSGTTPSLAVINHRAYSEGEYLRMPKSAGTTPLRIRVQRISDGAVTLQNGTQALLVPLHRQELSARKPDEQLLDPDR